MSGETSGETSGDTTATQISEPKKHVTEGQGFFTCLKCNDNFALLEGELETNCACSACHIVRVDTQNVIIAYPAYDLTPLVATDKLSVVIVRSPTNHERKVLFAISNKTTRNVAQTETDPMGVKEKRIQELQRTAASGINAAIQPAANYIVEAAQMGARVTWRSHYHTRQCGFEERDGVKYATHETTGDARFVCEVIVRDQKNEADGSLIFAPVRGCARCGKDHTQPVCFWKLTNAVVQHESGKAATLVATHFAYCPDTGEPIMMVTDIPTLERAEQFARPVRPGKVEEAVKSFDPIKAVDGARAVGMKAAQVRGIGGMDSPEFYDGARAASSGGTLFDCPHDPDTRQAADWKRGFEQETEGTP